MIEIDIAEIYDNSLRARLGAFQDMANMIPTFWTLPQSNGHFNHQALAEYLETEIEKLKEVLNGDPQSEYPG